VREPTGGLWQASLRGEGQGGRSERPFEGQSCEAIASAPALIVALSAEGGGGVARPPEVPEAPTVLAGGAAPESLWRPTPLSVILNGVIDGGTMPNSPA